MSINRYSEHSATAEDIEEKTEVIYGTKNIVGYAHSIMSILKESVDNCTNCNGLSMFVVPDHPITKAYKELYERGVNSSYGHN